MYEQYTDKQIERWVSANTSNIKIGSKVRVSDRDACFPEWFPQNGTVGTVISINDKSENAFVQWPLGSVSLDGKWYSPLHRLEVLLCE